MPKHESALAYDEMLMSGLRRMLLSNSALLTVAIFSPCLGLAASIVVQDFTWLSRSGALVVAVGIAFVGRFSVLGKDPRPAVNLGFGRNQLDPEYYRMSGKPIPGWLDGELRNRGAVGVIGPLVSLAGTLLWGFADLLNLLVGYGRQ